MPFAVYDPAGPDGVYACVRKALIDSTSVMESVSDIYPFVGTEGIILTRPYIVYNVLNNIHQQSTGPGKIQTSRIQIDTYGTNPDDLEEIGKLIVDAFYDAKFDAKNASVTKFLLVNRFTRQEPKDRSEEASVVFRHCIEFDAILSVTRI